jgi:hypothetical protein
MTTSESQTKIDLALGEAPRRAPLLARPPDRVGWSSQIDFKQRVSNTD